MATTYGYGGEFSSDEDLDKLEQPTEKLNNRFDANQQHIRPTKSQIEQTIEDIRRLPIEMDFNVSDDLLAGLLDYYKTQRGPIVDSTRKLYRKIVLRLVRGDSQNLQAGANNDNTIGSNGNANINNNNNNNNSNNNDNNVPVVHRPIQVADSFSSDDDEELVIDSLNKRKQAPYGTDNNNIIIIDDKMDADSDVMEVDPVEAPSGPVRGTKPVDIPTTTDEDSGEETDESSNSNESDSILEVTPIKPHGGRSQVTIMNNDAQKDDINSVIPKHPESSVKRQQPIAQSTPKETMDSVKKPYTRSQRMAAARVAAVKDGVSIDQGATSGKTQVNSARSDRQIAPRRKLYFLLTVSFAIGLLAFALYYFQSNIIKSTEPLFKRKITF